MSMAEFDREIRESFDALEKKINKGLEGGMVYGWNLITGGTPVKTGRARGSWLLTVDYIPSSSLPAVKSDKRVYADPFPPHVDFNFIKQRHLYIVNNVDYIEYLEYGTQKFAPFGMVMAAIPKINRKIQKYFNGIEV